MHTAPRPRLGPPRRCARKPWALEAAHVPLDFVSVLPRHLEHLPAICESHPELTIVIDHLCKPPVGSADLRAVGGL